MSRRHVHSPQDWEHCATVMEELAKDMREGKFIAASVEISNPPPPVIDQWYTEGPDLKDILPYAKEVRLTVSVEYGQTSVGLDMNGQGVIVHHDPTE